MDFTKCVNVNVDIYLIIMQHFEELSGIKGEGRMRVMSKVPLPREELVDSILVKYANTVYRLAFARTKNSYDAEDILQEVFMKYIKTNMEFKIDEHIKAWLLKVTINCSKNFLMVLK